jgi:hypothetical protein
VSSSLSPEPWLNCLLCHTRTDTHKVPSQVVHSSSQSSKYKQRPSPPRHAHPRLTC